MLDQCNLSTFYHIGVKSAFYSLSLTLNLIFSSTFLLSDHYSLWLPYGSLHFRPTIRLWSDCQDSKSVSGKGYTVSYTEKLIRSCQAYYLDWVIFHLHTEKWQKVNHMKMHRDVGGQKVTKRRITISILVKSGLIQGLIPCQITFFSDLIFSQ